MSWIALALIAPLFWAASNFVDKYVLGKHTKGNYDFLFFSSISSWLFLIVTLLIYGMPDIALIGPAADPHAWIPVLTGAMLIYSYWFYVKALEHSDASAIVILFKLIPVFTVVLGILFLGQILTTIEWIAFIVVLAGTTIASFEKKARRFSKGFGMILIAIIIWSALTLITDYGLEKMSFIDYFTLDLFGGALAALTFLPFAFMRKEIVLGIKTATPSKYGWFTLNNLLDLGGQTVLKQALIIAPSAGLVNVITQVQSFYAILIGIVLTVFMPHVIKEDISKKTLLKKSIGAAIMIAGIYILIAR